ncbi:MAG: ParA family protein [Xanthomonadales bacterium]|nr:ParA family protein [Xanthomonadales bacterium]
MAESLAILVCNRKGGVGKTTVATNLASQFAGQGWNTALVDCDTQQSSCGWLRRRADCNLPLSAVDAHSNAGLLTPTLRLKIPADAQCLIYDAPACSRGFDLTDLFRRVQLALVPIMPSPIDLAASRSFVNDLQRTPEHRSGRMAVGLIANRVRGRQLSSRGLREELGSWGVPVIGELRDSQLYVYSAGLGRGIHEFKGQRTAPDRDIWHQIYQSVLTMTQRTRPEPVPVQDAPRTTTRPVIRFGPQQVPTTGQA